MFTRLDSVISCLRTSSTGLLSTADLSILPRSSKSAFLNQLMEEMYFAKQPQVWAKLQFSSSQSYTDLRRTQNQIPLWSYATLENWATKSRMNSTGSPSTFLISDLRSSLAELLFNRMSKFLKDWSHLILWLELLEEFWLLSKTRLSTSTTWRCSFLTSVIRCLMKLVSKL